MASNTTPSAIRKVFLGNGNCPVCLDSLIVPETSLDTVSLACGHIFHEVCVKSALSEKSFCPICRSTLPPPQEEIHETPGPVTLVTAHEENFPPGRRRIPVASRHPENLTSVAHASSPISQRDASSSNPIPTGRDRTQESTTYSSSYAHYTTTTTWSWTPRGGFSVMSTETSFDRYSSHTGSRRGT